MVIDGYDIKPGANLTGANLEGANLEGANLTGADLTEAHLEGANLFEANLEGANLTGADLIRANLTEANLFEANLTGANLTRAILEGADLEGADLRGAILTRAILFGAILFEANLTGANLTRADLAGADLEGANLTGADLAGAILPQALSLQFCLALNSDIEGAITNVNQLLNLIKNNENNKEESNIYKGHLKWIEDNMEELIRNNHITDQDKGSIDDHNESRDLARLAQCSKDTNITTDKEGSSKGLTGVVRLLCVEGVLKPNDKGQEK